MKNKFKIFFALAIAVFLSLGCMSKALWEEKVVYVPYQDKIDSFMMNPKEGSTVFLGEKYHYIFTKNEDFNFLLAHRTSKGVVFNVIQGYHSVNQDSVTSNFGVKIDKSIADKAVVEWLNAKGYSNQQEEITLYLEGKRYKADKKVNAMAQKLSKQFTLSINEAKIEDKNTAYKVLMTPLAVVADGVLVVVGGVVLVFVGLDSIGR